MKAFPFMVGEEYRRSELLEFIGSRQAQSGVLWGPVESGCIICTSGGRHGKKVGYFDEPQADGTWLYFGQGRTGNHDPRNAANAKLAQGDKTVLLFTTREPTAREVEANLGYGKLFTFQGPFNVAATDAVSPTSGPRAGDMLLRFTLVPAGSPSEDGARISLGVGASTPEELRTLREQLNSAATTGPAAGQLGLVAYRSRSKAVHRYAMLRAGGFCELCQGPAPFSCEEGIPFLEVHHLHRLADDGPDAPGNVAAICPNCHRATHHSVDRQQLKARLVEAVHRKESELDSAAAPAVPPQKLVPC